MAREKAAVMVPSDVPLQSSKAALKTVSPNENIVIRGARTHNLKGIDVDIPHNMLTVVSGVSGSGKSSLAFDTVYAEGQRRYVESLSAYARQFLERIEKPDVDHMDGLAPAIAIKQKNQTRNPRSTVATATEIYDYMRLLYARCGTVTCLHCGGIVKRDTVDEIAASILALGDDTRLFALFPIERRPIVLEPMQDFALPVEEAPAKPAAKPKKLSTRKVKAVEAAPVSDPSDPMRERLVELRRRGYNRLFQNGNIVEFSTPESLLELNFSEPIYVLADRLAVSAEVRARIVDAIETGYRESGEIVFLTAPRDGSEPQRIRFSSAFECTNCHRAYRDPEPRLFSFNNPFGACPRCQGFGNTIDFDPDLIIPDKGKSLDDGAIDPWTKPKYREFHGMMKRFATASSIPTKTAWYDLTPAQQNAIWDGGSGFIGIRGFFRSLDSKKYKLHVRVFLSKYRGYAPCPDCRGQRLRAEARAVLLNDKNICEAAALTITGARIFFEGLELSPAQTEIAGKILEEVRQRIGFLEQVGLEYLTLDRLSSTLSGGESQRIQLASSLGSRLVGALYVLDEPSIGLHSRDTAKLIKIMHELRDLGNTVLVVEHDPDVILAADRLVDLGPGAGELGGELLAIGTVEQVKNDPKSITGKYLSGRTRIPVPQERREPTRELLKLKGARIHNLRGVDLEIPLGMLTVVTGVSGSGKSTIVHQVLHRALQHALGVEGASGDVTQLYRELTGTHFLREVVLVDQSPIGRTPRSNPVTYIKAFDAIRELFAAQPDSRRKNYTGGSFSFNVPGGRCDTCEGDGTVTVEMQFLADIELPCEECGGSRYKPGILDVKYKNKNIHDVLNMTVKDAVHYFAGNPKIVERLQVLDEVGLGYVRLGQSATTLSGGEAQRVKLASHLANIRTGTRGGETKKAASRVLYILDEPTTGLHFADVATLLQAFRKLIEGGGSLLVIEHNMDIIKCADWVIDMGPEGGAAGGQVVAVGTPEEIAKVPGSYTGQWLAPVLE
ncbi:excinuclease ABC subunit A [Terriglobus roseus]|uniref:UvrABC system protein A n=2 Tax=Terriglobus roseus TaxID=392734 RepID=A0A1H4IVK9_9BACT|nr:excinuclease ABC subunit A [Terriglobus roseus]